MKVPKYLDDEGDIVLARLNVKVTCGKLCLVVSYEITFWLALPSSFRKVPYIKTRASANKHGVQIFEIFKKGGCKIVIDISGN